ncbi:very short patch repair endonuclease [Geodermatophilus obscurus]|uniref:very short patch repair endonuclease n=1 Tax=Geodermatophilus obscurus TaxID=1861 RepID=UPI001AD8D367|nr:very short patch repair endonuclease [Geodermatophilus obscurus]
MSGGDITPQPGSDAPEAAAGRPVPISPGRSRNLAAIRRTGTKPELALRSALHARGWRFRKDYRLDLPDGRVRPDVVFTRRQVAVFVDGCFWHACPIHGREPTRNTGYWSPKLARNVERDRRNNAALMAAGWTVVRVWEHEPLANAVTAVEEALRRALA